MDPLWLNRVQPGTFDGEPARNDAHACFACLSFLQNCLIVLTQPGSDLLTHMPGGVIPNEDEHLFALRLDLLTEPLQKIGRYLADRTSRHKAEVHATTGGFKHAITGKRFGIGIVLVHCQFL